MKSRMTLAVALALSLGFSSIVPSFAAMGGGYGGGGGGNSSSGGGGYGGGGQSHKIEQTVKKCKKGAVWSKTAHKCVKASY
ncbi:MAG TPA: hypothetical protein VL101_14910 [Nordella sp.]|nr:hypothetical protein [Nordella sp.]